MRAFVTAAVSASLLVLTCTTPSRADWPANRHDAARSATGDGVSRINKPRVAWRHYLGGGVAQDQLIAWDVNRDGFDDFLYVSGGRLFAKTAQDMLLWRTSPLNATRIDGLADVDGDGATEVLVSGDRLIHLIRLRDGAVTWSIPMDHIGTPGAVRVADFDRDGVADVYVADLACGSPDSRGDVAEVWSFVPTPRRLFALERGRRDYVCGANDTVVDLNRDGTLEVVIQGSEYFYVYSGADGALISRSDSIGSIPYGLALTRVANVDGDPDLELVAFVDSNYGVPITTRRVFMMDWDAGTRRLVRRWERSVDPVANDNHAYGVGSVGDLGANGSIEVVTSFHNATTDTWRTLVLDAETGIERAAVPEGPFRGLVDLSPAPGPEVVVGDQQQGTHVYRWDGGGLTLLFQAERFDPVVTRTEDAAAPSTARNGLISLDLDSTEPKELLGFSYGLDSTVPEAMLAVNATDGTANTIARGAVPLGAANPVVVRTRNDTSAKPKIAVAYSSGFLWVLDDDLRPLNVSSGDVPWSGMQLGGYYSGQQGLGRVPLGGDLDGDGSSEIVVVDSRNAVLALNAAHASLTNPPVIRWEISGGRSPVLLDLDGDRRYEVAYWTTTPRANALRLVHGNDASGIWQRTIGTSDLSPLNDLMVGDLNGDHQPDIVYSLLSSVAGTLHMNVASGKNSADLWSADFQSVVTGIGYGAGSLLDRESDGKLDILAAPRNLLQWLTGRTGATGPSVAAGFPDYGLLVPAAGGAPATLVNSGSSFTVSSFSVELEPRWSIDSTEQGRTNGAIVRCSNDKTVYVAGHFGSARISAWNVSDGKLEGELVLSDGTVSAVSAGTDPPTGRLASLILSPDLVGAGRPSVVVPSGDGYLYAIDACAMKLDWALNLEAPVGEAILVDTDNDGEDEIVVTAADGYLYGIDREALTGPAYVYENDGSGPVTSAEGDVDWLLTQDTLYANWAAVDGAISYQYAVLDATGTSITGDPIDVGSATSVTASGLPLEFGMRYRFSVHAVGPDGLSIETLSDGVIAGADPCLACGDGTRCVEKMCVVDAGDGDASSLCDSENSEPPAPQCAACGSGTCCEDGMCVAAPRPRAKGCSCSAAERESSTLAPYFALMLVSVFILRRRQRATSLEC